MDEIMRARVFRSLGEYFLERGPQGALVKYATGYRSFEIVVVGEDHDGAYIDPLDAAPHREPIEWIIALGDLIPTKEDDLRAALAAATERAEVQTHRSARLLEAAQIMGSERDAATARADALAARLAEVDGEHPA